MNDLNFRVNLYARSTALGSMNEWLYNTVSVMCSVTETWNELNHLKQPVQLGIS